MKLDDLYNGTLSQEKIAELKQKREAAISLLQAGIDAEMVAVATELDLEDIIKLSKKAKIY